MDEQRRICRKCQHDTAQWLGKGETTNGHLTCGHGRDFNDPCGCHCEVKEIEEYG
jgi:hypothetical protein